MISRDTALYALGVGACSTDAVDIKELKYVYHQDGQQSIEVLKGNILFKPGSWKEIIDLIEMIAYVCEMQV